MTNTLETAKWRDIIAAPYPCPACGAPHPFDNVLCADGYHSPDEPFDIERTARALLADQMTDERKRKVLLSKSPATYAGGITANQAIRAIAAALRARAQKKDEPDADS